MLLILEIKAEKTVEFKEYSSKRHGNVPCFQNGEVYNGLDKSIYSVATCKTHGFISFLVLLHL